MTTPAYIIDILCLLVAPEHPPLLVIALIQFIARRWSVTCRGFMTFGVVQALPESVRLVLLPGLAPAIEDAKEDTKSESEPSSFLPSEADPFDMLTAPTPVLSQDLARLPKLVRMADLRPWPRSPTALPLGLGPDGRPRWIDLMDDALHVGIYAQSGAGKDSLLRAWFAWLTRQNPSEDVQFVFLDGKGDWLTPDLAHRAHMWRPPAGGYGEPGAAAIRAAIRAVDQEAARRQQLIFGANVRTRERYQEATGERMPLLVVVASDVMDTVAGEVEALLISLVSKARALGIRVVVSMQTPTGKNMQWRMNLSTVIAGALQDSSQDAPALGLRDVKALRYRPSELPPARVRPGVFVVRSGGEQSLVQAPFLSEDVFDRFVDSLPERDESSIVYDDSVVLHSTKNGHTEHSGSATLHYATTAIEGIVMPNSGTTHLPDDDEAVMIRNLLQTYSRNKVAKLLGGSMTTAYKRIHRALGENED